MGDVELATNGVSMGSATASVASVAYVAVGGGDGSGGGGGFTSKRPAAQRLEPLTTNRLPDIDEMMTDDAASTSLDSTSRPPKSLDIGFNNLTYSVKTGIMKRASKRILEGLNGDFKSGDLSAIMGPSGAGKSTLMDILAGYTTANIGGKVTVNGRERDIKKFRHQSAYIMQDHQLQPLLTVVEAMHFSVNLKIGDEMSQIKKKARIKQIIEAIGLSESQKTRTGKLSGGQRKRLAIALELVDNPPVMFFDEPTSGLDSSTSTQCVSLLKKLAAEGRTIICIIHQPSALVFKMFDHLLTIAEGKCIYSGGTQYVVQFLEELGLICPEFYNPSDYLLEISTNDYGPLNDRLVEKTQNGCNQSYRRQSRQSVSQTQEMERAEQMMQRGIITPVKAPNLMSSKRTPLSPVFETVVEGLLPIVKPKKSIYSSDCFKQNETYTTTFCRQFSLLLKRQFLILWRDKSLTSIRLLVHFIVGLTVGTLFLGIGNDAAHIIDNFRYIFMSIMFLMFTAYSSITMAFPLELAIIIREHFNRWYSLRAYYIAMTLADAPIQLACTSLYILITYFLTSQPLELFRISLFFAMCLMVCLVAQSIGLVIGSLFSVKHGAIFGPFFICPFLIFSGFFIQISHANPIMHWLFHISFLKYALEGGSLAIFGYDRPKMQCDELFCPYVWPKKFMKAVDMDDGDFVRATIAMGIFFLVFRVIAYFVMLFRLKFKR